MLVGSRILKTIPSLTKPMQEKKAPKEAPNAQPKGIIPPPPQKEMPPKGNAGATVAQPPQKTPEQVKEEERANATIKEIENAFLSLRFYPVAAQKESKEKALDCIKNAFKKENETVRQLILYLIHENLSAVSEYRMVHNFDYFKRKNPQAENSQNRMNVYRAMFNYNHSVEGLIDFIMLLAGFNSDDATKLLTYHFAHLSQGESEAVRILRNACIGALGKTESAYALRCLIEYAKYAENEGVLGRVYHSLGMWDKKLESIKLPKKEKEELIKAFAELKTNETAEKHYG